MTRSRRGITIGQLVAYARKTLGMRTKSYYLGLVALVTASAGETQDLGDASYLRARISAFYPIACGTVAQNDVPGGRAQKAAREALASYAKALADIRRQQILAAQRFTTAQMDVDEKEARVEGLGKQIEQLELLTNTEGACPLLSILPVAQANKDGVAAPTPEILSPARVGPRDQLFGRSDSKEASSASAVPDVNEDHQTAYKDAQEPKAATTRTPLS